jgi:hypothetical protein
MYISPEYKNERLEALDVIMASVNYNGVTNVENVDIDGDGTVESGTFTKLNTSVNFSNLLTMF